MLVWGINDDVHDDWPANENIQKAKYVKKSANTQIQKRPVPTDSQIPSYLDHFPDDTSTRPFVHFAQLHKSGKIFLINDNNNGEGQWCSWSLFTTLSSTKVVIFLRKIWVLRLRTCQLWPLWPEVADHLWFVQGACPPVFSSHLWFLLTLCWNLWPLLPGDSNCLWFAEEIS